MLIKKKSLVLTEIGMEGYLGNIASQIKLSCPLLKCAFVISVLGVLP